MKTKHIPERTCVGCRTVLPKKELVRIVRDPQGLVDVDLTGRKSGRGVYICPKHACLDLAVKGGRLKSGLEVDIPADVISRLRERLQGE